MSLRGAGIGSLPGSDMPAALRLVLAETPDVVAIPELPARGVGADMVGRAAAMLSGLAVDLQPAGWRLTDNPGIDQRRALGLLRRDLDDLEEQAQGFSGVLKLAVTGPWTMAALVERPRGDKVLADHGARRDLAQSLAEGVAGLLSEMTRRLPEATWWLQVDEPLLAAVLEGRIDTASSFSKHRAVEAADAVELLDGFSSLAGTTAVHWCGAPGMGLMARTGFAAVSVDVARLGSQHLDGLAAWLEAGRQVWWGTIPTEVPDRVQAVDVHADRLSRLFEVLGLGAETLLGGLVTPACGLGGWSPLPAAEVLRQAVRVAGQVTERLHD